MDEFSLYILDITMNSVRAGSSEIHISLTEKDGFLYFSVTDDGCGMTPEQKNKLTDPFFTTRTTRSVGLGVPLLKMLSEMTDGEFSIESATREESPEHHGTTLSASFRMDHIDFIPLGDIVGTVTSLIQGSPDINFVFDHKIGDETIHLSCRELREILGDGISLASYEVLQWIKGYLNEAYQEVRN